VTAPGRAARAASAMPLTVTRSSKPSPRSNPNPPPSETSRRHTHSRGTFSIGCGNKLRRRSYSNELPRPFQFRQYQLRQFLRVQTRLGPEAPHLQHRLALLLSCFVSSGRASVRQIPLFNCSTYGIVAKIRCALSSVSRRFSIVSKFGPAAPLRIATNLPRRPRPSELVAAGLIEHLSRHV